MIRSRSALSVKDSPVYHLMGETLTVPASNGTRSAYTVRPGYTEVMVYAVLASRISLVPAIKGLVFYDASSGAYINLLAGTGVDLSNRGASVTTNILSAMTSSDYLYVGSVDVIGGFHLDLVTPFNTEAATLAAQYGDPALGWRSLTVATDGTSSGGATLAQDGNVMFTVPTDWRGATLQQLLPTATGLPSVAGERPLLWARFSVNATLSASVTVTTITPMSRIAPVTDDVAALSGGGFLEATAAQVFDIHPDIGALETMAVAAAATTARVTWVAR